VDEENAGGKGMSTKWYFYLMCLALFGGQNIAKGCFIIMVADTIIKKWCKTKGQVVLCVVIAVLIDYWWIWG
jgi:hypothetical protein